MLVGSSGCGKSTILKLLKQYYKSHSIYIKNKKLKNINLKNSITYISQDEYLFTDTLYNNITMYKNVSDKELNKVIDICELRPIINRTNLGFNMLIEENGFNLSGGEKQRIMLARALLKNFEILIIDEGLNQVDINLERKILKNIFKKYKDKTIIVVSHRLDNLDLFDNLIRIEKGVVVDEAKRV